jgi:Transposase DDE domain
MSNSLGPRLTDLRLLFLEPKNSVHRQYEALRAFFVEGRSSSQAARQFGYTPGSFRILCHQFRQNPDWEFFLSSRRAPQQDPRRDRGRERIVSLRKQNLSIYDISRALAEKGEKRSPAAVALILKEEGFQRLPRRHDEERPQSPRASSADVADVRTVDLSAREFRTQFGGLFLFLPFLARIPWGEIVKGADLPGSQMIPAEHALRSLLGLKLFGSRRHSHVMADVFDEGLALFAGLNVIPKRSFLTEYSCRIRPASYPKLMRRWFDAVGHLGLRRGASFDLDFHTIPFHGEDALVEKHYVSKRSRRQKGILAFLALDAEKRVFCYANGQLRKADQNDEILRFVEFWKEKTGHLPAELIFDSRLTSYANLSQLNKLGIAFMTLRRRSRKLLEQIYATPLSAWRRIRLKSVGRIYSTPRILDNRIKLPRYAGPLRQLSITDLGHQEPTLLLTNQLHRAPTKLIERYAQRMVIENSIAEAINFFHMDALSSAVAMKVNCDLQLTLMASSLYRLLGLQLGNGYEAAKADHLFRDFVNATAHVRLTEQDIVVRFQKRAHNPLLLAAGLEQTRIKVPWLGGKRLRFQFG